ncbi:MAG: FMN-binding protein [Treponema sp.]|nr:FMN-binding protein [Treponema sp.]
MRTKSLTKKYFFTAILFCFILIITCCSTAYKNLQAKLPDLNEKQDGAYQGEYDLSGTPVRVSLEVVLKGKIIDSINIKEHICSPIGKKAEAIIDKIITQQSLDIDAVSGATGSSKAILKAVENALQ